MCHPFSSIIKYWFLFYLFFPLVLYILNTHLLVICHNMKKRLTHSLLLFISILGYKDVLKSQKWGLEVPLSYCVPSCRKSLYVVVAWVGTVHRFLGIISDQVCL